MTFDFPLSVLTEGVGEWAGVTLADLEEGDLRCSAGLDEVGVGVKDSEGVGFIEVLAEVVFIDEAAVDSGFIAVAVESEGIIDFIGAADVVKAEDSVVLRFIEVVEVTDSALVVGGIDMAGEGGNAFIDVIEGVPVMLLY